MSIVREAQSPEMVEVERQAIMELVWPAQSPKDIYDSMLESGVKINKTSIAAAVAKYKAENPDSTLGSYGTAEAMRGSDNPKRSDSENFLIRYKSCLKKRDSSGKFQRTVDRAMSAVNKDSKGYGKGSSK